MDALLALAIHEAGHAVVADALGMSVQRLLLSTRRGGRGGSQRGAFAPYAPTRDEDEAVSLAGPVAEARAWGWPPLDLCIEQWRRRDPDFRHWRGSTPTRVRRAALVAAVARAEALVEPLWLDILAVAEALLAAEPDAEGRREFWGDDFRRVVRPDAEPWLVGHGRPGRLGGPGGPLPGTREAVAEWARFGVTVNAPGFTILGPLDEGKG